MHLHIDKQNFVTIANLLASVFIFSAENLKAATTHEEPSQLSVAQSVSPENIKVASPAELPQQPPVPKKPHFWTWAPIADPRTLVVDEPENVEAAAHDEYKEPSVAQNVSPENVEAAAHDESKEPSVTQKLSPEQERIFHQIEGYWRNRIHDIQQYTIQGKRRSVGGGRFSSLILKRNQNMLESVMKNEMKDNERQMERFKLLPPTKAVKELKEKVEMAKKVLEWEYEWRLAVMNDPSLARGVSGLHNVPELNAFWNQETNKARAEGRWE